MTLLNLHLRMIGMTVNCKTVSVIQHNLSIGLLFEKPHPDSYPLSLTIKSSETQNNEIIRKRQITPKSETACNEMKKMITDASMHAAKICMKNLYNEFIYGNYLLN